MRKVVAAICQSICIPTLALASQSSSMTHLACLSLASCREPFGCNLYKQGLQSLMHEKKTKLANNVGYE